MGKEGYIAIFPGGKMARGENGSRTPANITPYYYPICTRHNPAKQTYLYTDSRISHIASLLYTFNKTVKIAENSITLVKYSRIYENNLMKKKKDTTNIQF